MADLPPEWRARGAFTFSTLGNKALKVLTNQGLATAYVGDYIAIDPGGSFYPVPAALWEARYDLVRDK